ncbi:MAG: hypothetical protein JXM79_25430 [Sedimentisphaerales bacterium]|nr:hypothetical protein [Sedimentisphaerales bacterium]
MNADKNILISLFFGEKRGFIGLVCSQFVHEQFFGKFSMNEVKRIETGPSFKVVARCPTDDQQH